MKEEQIAPNRQTFDQVFFERSEGFMREQLMLIPELEGIAIVPTWTTEQGSLPFGITKGRNGPLRSAAELFRMCQQLQGVYEIHLRRLREVLGAYEQRAQQIVEAITTKTAELDELEKLIKQRKETLDGLGNGTPPGS